MTLTRQQRKGCFAGLFLLVLQMPSAFADALTDQAKSLLDTGKAGEAYTLLAQQESARAGEPGFDFLLGLAALDIGQNTRAVFALERVLALEPNNALARAEIARAYLALGEVETARKEFETVQRQGVPADVSQTLERYIAAARHFEDQSKPSINGFVEAMIGYDTNVNVGPSKASIVIPGISSAPATLADDSRANKDSFGQIGAGVNARVPLTTGVALLAGVSGTQRFNAHKDQFDLGNLDGNAGLVMTAGKNVFTVMGQIGSLDLDYDRYRTASGITGQWQHNLDARNQASGFAQYSNLHYSTQEIRDADRWLGGLAYAHMWREGAVGFASAYLVSEKPQANGVDYIGFDGFGLRLGSRWNIGERGIVFAGANYEQRRYDGVDPSFQVERKDKQFGLLFGANYALAKDWSITPQLVLTRNQSNIEISEYHREVFSLAIRRDF